MNPMPSPLQLIPIPGLPEVEPGTDLSKAEADEETEKA